MNGIRALVACIDAVVAAADEPLVEPRTDLRDLVGEEVSKVTAHPHGICFRFGSGAAIVVPRGVILDGVGNSVVEP